ncbi:MAG: CPBP family intramembrane metalloprotease [Clostridia bacterium]|nr:CPBP family intramembrane metalloprotease [Clostridia bacterium]
MKCPHCNFERELPFKFCPMCGVETVEKVDFCENSAEIQPQPQAVTNVKRIPYGLTEQTYKERKEIKKLSRISAFSFLCLDFFASIMIYVVLYTLLAFGFSYNRAVNFIEDPYFSNFFQITVSSLMFILPFTLIYKIFGYKISNIIDFNLPKTKSWFPIVLMGVGFCSFANIATGIASSFFEGFGINYEVDFGENPQGVLGITLSILATAVVPALVEEFACRGIVLGSLRKYGEGFAVLTTAIMFGLIHGNFQQIPFAFMVGLILGFVTVKTGSIWPAILIHFYNNFSSVIFDYVFDGMAIELQNVIYTIYLIVCLFIGILGVLLLRNNTEIFKFAPSNTDASEKQKYKWYFLTETTIFVILICIVNSLQYFSK